MPSGLRNGTDRRRGAHVGARSAEVELLLGCTVRSGRADKVSKAIRRGVDWDLFTRMAVAHGVLAPVYRCLEAPMTDDVPAGPLAGLRQRYLANALQGTHATGELLRLMKLFAANQISALAFKGPVLSLLAYGGVSMRQYNDLDLLVRESETARALDILGADGYAPQAGYDAGDVGRRGAFELSLVRPGSLAVIDLHWRLVPPYFPVALDGEELWQRAISADFDGGAVPTMALEDQMLYLCAHGAKHGWQALGGICDLAELMRAAPIDWDGLCARAERAGARRMLLLGTLLAHDLLDAQAPEHVLAAARREGAVVRAARTFIRYVNGSNCEGPRLYQRWSIPLRMIAGPRARIRYLAARALLPSADDRGFVRLPPALRPLYFVLRPLRIALKESGAALRKLTRPGASPADHASG